jgi:predicted transcriptional regulator YheO
LVLGFDLAAVDAARRVTELLAIGWDDSERPAGAFTHVEKAMDELISLAEQSVGRSLADMNRLEKQRVVRFLDERGAFALRKSVERVADALGVSRFTVYNYLDASRQS